MSCSLSSAETATLPVVLGVDGSAASDAAIGFAFEAAAARKVAGVLDVVQVPTGVAVIARDTWAAMKGREALTVTWDDSTKTLLLGPPLVITADNVGDFDY